MLSCIYHRVVHQKHYSFYGVHGTSDTRAPGVLCDSALPRGLYVERHILNLDVLLISVLIIFSYRLCQLHLWRCEDAALMSSCKTAPMHNYPKCRDADQSRRVNLTIIVVLIPLCIPKPSYKNVDRKALICGDNKD